MRAILLTWLAGLAMIAIGLFPEKEYVLAISLTIVGLSFLQDTNMNSSEFFAMVLIGVSGTLMLLDYKWWTLLPAISGAILAFSFMLNDYSKNFFNILKAIIGVCLIWIMNDVSWVSFLAGGSMIVLGFSYIVLDPHTGDATIMII